MSPVDAEEYSKSLELHGLDRSSANPDFVIVHAHDQSVYPPCDWLILFEYEQRLIATMKGNDSLKLIVPASQANYDPDAVKHYSPDEMERLFEFVGREGNIDTYRNKENGELIYHARRTETADEIFARAFQIVWEHRREFGDSVKGDIASRLNQPIQELQSLTAQYPEEARLPLALGMAWYAMGKAENARKNLERAAQLDPTSISILKELGGLCLDQGDLPRALEVATKGVAVKPDDSDLLGNLALIQMLSGDCVKANQTITFALEKAPNDTINRNTRTIIQDVLSGRREQPKTLADLTSSPPPKKKSFFGKLFGF